MQLSVRRARGRQELKEIVKRSADRFAYDESEYVSLDLEHAVGTLERLMRSGNGDVLVAVNEAGDVVGTVAFQVGPIFFHSPDPVVSQIYCYPFASGFPAVRIVRVLHRAMIRYAVLKKVKLVTSSSYIPTAESFVKILERDGWEVSGALARYRVTDADRIEFLPAGAPPNLPGGTAPGCSLVGARVNLFGRPGQGHAASGCRSSGD